MKKSMVLITVLLLITGCGTKIHENVDEKLANDSMQVFDKIIENVENDNAIEDVSESDHELFESYYDKYIKDKVISSDYKGADKSIQSLTGGTLVKYSKGISLESDKKDILDSKELMEKIIKTGKAAGE